MKTLLLLDTDQTVTASPDFLTVYWSRLVVLTDGISIPALVEKSAIEIRTRYLRWVHDLGLVIVNGRTVRTWLSLSDTFSFWWMTLIAEKAPLKSENIYVVFKLFALQNLYREQQCTALIYCGNDLTLDRIFRVWSRRVGHPYTWQKTHLTTTAPRALRSTLPHPLRAIALGFKKIWRTLMAQPNRVMRFPSLQQITIVTYFPNIDFQQTERGRFWSRYWERLHLVLDELPVSVNWVWLYAQSDQCSYQQAIQLRDQCNRYAPEKYHYFLLDEFLTLGSFFNIVREYFKLFRRYFALTSLRNYFSFDHDGFNFYPLMESDWWSSLSGNVAADGLWYRAVFDQMARQLPARPFGLFIWENQAWESALIDAWRTQNVSCIIAYQHSSVRLLELRMLDDQRLYDDSRNDTRPRYDVLAINGMGAYTMLRKVGFPESQLCLVEALRYLHLANLVKREKSVSHLKTLLVVTGYRQSETAFQMKILMATAEHGGLGTFNKILIKPHPFSPVAHAHLESLHAYGLEVNIINTPLHELWSQVDIVFVANSTTTVLDAVYAFIPVVVCVSENEMNFSPAFGESFAPMIVSSTDLIKFFQSPFHIDAPTDYFILDSSMTRWRKLLYHNI